MPIRPALATELLRLHHQPEPLLVMNVWDAASAKLVQELGFRCVATTSGGVAAAHGYEDGEQISRDEVIAAIGRIARVTHLPLTADMEAGYGATPADVAETVRRALEAGAVGFNLEDGIEVDGHPGIRDAHEQAERLRAAREACVAAGVPDAVINARIDVFLHQVGDPAGRVEATLERARIYASAGASCAFPAGVRDREEIRALVAGCPLPVNVLVYRDVPPVAELAGLGVRRISVGSRLLHAALRAVRTAALEIRDAGTYDALFGEAAHPVAA
ncbi:MAG TPA: isocitrate lyase/phosphoenolpyruvate mutase family protein [Longimicrobium sp.]|nr:isocitrate lyase/phosphoenolpyruvate mutase family protein [Longimicrobium sp.]